jgi:hypothetical protein
MAETGQDEPTTIDQNGLAMARWQTIVFACAAVATFAFAIASWSDPAIASKASIRARLDTTWWPIGLASVAIGSYLRYRKLKSQAPSN